MQGFVITTTGEEMLARASAGEELKLTGVAVGQGVAESAAQAKALTSLLDQVAAATSTTPSVSAGQVSVIVEYRNDLNGGLETGFTLTEFGVFARIGDELPALLYYAALGDNAHPVKAAADGLDIHRFPVAIAVTGDVEITLAYPAGAFVATEELEEALKKLDLSGYIPAADKGKADGVATLGADGILSETQRPNAAGLKMQNGKTVEDTVKGKQDSISGKAGQVVGFNSDGKPVAVSMEIYAAQDTAPDDTGIFWVDTGNGGILKYYNGTEWTAVSASW